MQIPLKALNALQVAVVAAATFVVALVVVAPGDLAGGARSERTTASAASRAYVAALGDGLRDIVSDARSAALFVRPDDEALSDAERAVRLRDWLALKPQYRDAALIAGDGLVAAAADERRLGASVAGRSGFARGRFADVAIAVDGTGPDAAFDVVVSLAGAGRAGALQLRADPRFFTSIAERVRRALPLPRTAGFAVTGPDGRAISAYALPSGDDAASATLPMPADPGIGMPGWLVTAHVPRADAPVADGMGLRIAGAGLLVVAVVALLGYLAGGRAAVPLARLARDEGEADEAPARSPVREIAVVSEAFARRRRSSDLVVAGTGAGLERLRGRLRTFETMSGWSCWEIDLDTGQVVWSDPDAGGATADRMTDLAAFVARFEPADLPLLQLTQAAALAEDGAHDVVLRDRAHPGQYVLVRFLRGVEPTVGARRRIYALSRDVRPNDDALSPSGANERRRNVVLRRVTDGIVHDFNDVLTVVLANLAVLARRHAPGGEQDRLIGRAVAGAQRGAALTRRLLQLVRGESEGPGLAESDVAATVEAYLPFLAANVLGDMPILNRIPADLPKVLCSERILELVLLNIAFHFRDAGLGGFAVGAAEYGPGDGPALILPHRGVAARAPAPAPERYVRILVASGRPTAGRPEGSVVPHGLDTVSRLIAEAGGGWRLVRDGTEAGAFLAEFWLPAAARRASPQPSDGLEPLRILLVESDALVRASVAEALADLGHAVVQAASGEHALDLLGDAEFDAMIADQSMPVMTGLQLAATVVERHPGVRVILASPHGQLPASARAFLRIDKPFRSEDLEGVLHIAAAERRAA